MIMKSDKNKKEKFMEILAVAGTLLWRLICLLIELALQTTLLLIFVFVVLFVLFDVLIRK